MSTLKQKLGASSAALAGFALVMVPVPAEAASVPSCVKATVHDYKRYDHVDVKNTCTKSYYIKVRWAHETDSQCEWLGAGYGTMSSERQWPARYDGLLFC